MIKFSLLVLLVGLWRPAEGQQTSPPDELKLLVASLDDSSPEVREGALTRLQFLVWKHADKRQRLLKLSECLTSPESNSRAKEALSRVRQVKCPANARALMLPVKHVETSLLRIAFATQSDAETEPSVESFLLNTDSLTMTMLTPDSPEEARRLNFRKSLLNKLRSIPDFDATTDLSVLEPLQFANGYVVASSTSSRSSAYLFATETGQPFRLEPTSCGPLCTFSVRKSCIIAFEKNFAQALHDAKLQSETIGPRSDAAPIAYQLTSPIGPWTSIPPPPECQMDLVSAHGGHLAICGRSGECCYWSSADLLWHKIRANEHIPEPEFVQLSGPGLLVADRERAEYFRFDDGKWLQIEGWPILRFDDPYSGPFVRTRYVIVTEAGDDCLLVQIGTKLDGNPSCDEEDSQLLLIDVTAP